MAQLSKLLLLLCLPFSLASQNIPIETWRNHFSYSNIQHITSSDQNIICAAENGIFYINKADRSINLLSKIDGLSDVGASDIVYDRSSGSLVIGYPSGLIDIYRDGNTITVSAIYESLLVGDKSIKDIEVRNDRIYASNGFGIIVINLNNGEIIENFQSIGVGATDVEAFESASNSDYLAAITTGGLQFGSINQNLLDFNNWKILDSSENAYSNLTFLSDESLAVIVNDTSIYSYNLKSSDKVLLYSSPSEINDLALVNNQLYFLSNNTTYSLNNGNLTSHTSFDDDINMLFYDEQLWFGSKSNGLLDNSLTSFYPNGPLKDDITKIAFVNGSVFSLYGPNVEIYESGHDGLGYDVFDNSTWTNIVIPGFDNLTDAESFQDNIYLASASDGLMNLTTKEKIAINQSTSSNLTTISSLASSDQLYITCFDHQTPLITMDEDGTLTPYQSDYTITSFPTDIQISERETIWLTRSTLDGGGIITLELDEDQFRVINNADGLTSNKVNNVAISLSDEAWVATGSGLVSYNDASFIFDNTEAIPAYFDGEELFTSVNVTAVAIDGGNRVWVGTENQGIWVFDSNFSQLAYRFTFLNSSLPSNTIKDFAYNSNNGEMFILTDKGLSSFRSNSSLAQTVHTNVNIFPNPVRPGYQGKVGVTGLVNNASVKITDVNGKLMKELNANGGTISWDLTDYNNHRVSSGIYILFSSNNPGDQTYIGKLAVVNE